MLATEMRQTRMLRNRILQGKKRQPMKTRCLLLAIYAATIHTCWKPAMAQPPVSPHNQQSGIEPPAPQPTPAPTEAPATGAASEEAAPSMFPHFRDTRFWLTGQMNFIFQTHTDFPAEFNGPNSFGPNYDKATSRVLTLYTGVRLNNSTALIADIEEAGGAALSTGLGLGGFTNLDIVRNPLLSKRPYLARAMIHKVFALSKDKVENERTALSLFNELPRRRVEIRFGKFSLPDFFDVNSAGSDTHFQFNNWAVDNNGAWDYAADTRGYTVGLMAEYQDRRWGFRFAEALMPKDANGIDLVWRPWEVHSENFEYELRRGLLPRKSGTIRLLAYSNSANMGIYRDAVANFLNGVTPVPDITDHPWHITRKYGFGVNLEQALSPYVTAFARFGWNNGKTESFAYTEIDQTFLEGVGVNGSLWRRKFDRAGVAFVSSGISRDHQNYLAHGGLGFLLGDGGLVYGRENILETYYTIHVWRGIYLSPGAHYIVNPGYNRARGPVWVGSFRFHTEL
jgi:hypothetical protein